MKKLFTSTLLALTITACTTTPTAPKQTIKQLPKPKVALVLGGGGAKGFAQKNRID